MTCVDALQVATPSHSVAGGWSSSATRCAQPLREILGWTPQLPHRGPKLPVGVRNTCRPTRSLADASLSRNTTSLGVTGGPTGDVMFRTGDPGDKQQCGRELRWRC